MLLTSSGHLTNEVEMLSYGVGAVGNDVMLQHWKHLHVSRYLARGQKEENRDVWSLRSVVVLRCVQRRSHADGQPRQLHRHTRSSGREKTQRDMDMMMRHTVDVLYTARTWTRADRRSPVSDLQRNPRRRKRPAAASTALFIRKSTT